MASIDYLSPGERKKVLDEILNNEENLRRKEQSLMAFEIFKGRQAQFILRKMANELGVEAAKNSRTITSINLTKKFIKEQASLYKNDPERLFSDLNENQTLHALSLYQYAKANIKLKKANEFFKLIEQAALQIVLKDGRPEIRALMPHHYDVVPKIENPEKADAYIVSSFDKWRLFSSVGGGVDSSRGYEQKNYFADFNNQRIGDPDDYRGNALFYWWTDDYNFITDKNGNIVDERGQVVNQVNVEDIKNPISKMPFVDVAADKDFEFFVRSGNNVAQMTVDLGILLSDVTEIARLQGFSQGVISSVEQPKDMIVGPRRLVWLKVSPNDTDATRPQFSFVSPSPDLNASLQLVSNYLSIFLTSQGLSPKIVNAQGDKETYSSGVDRYLAMVERFEASQDDMSLFKDVENQVWSILKAWNNVYYQATSNGFIDELSGVYIPDDSKLTVNFKKPQMLMNDSEKLATLEKKLELGLITMAEAIAQDRNIDLSEAEEIRQKIEFEERVLISGAGIKAEA